MQKVLSIQEVDEVRNYINQGLVIKEIANKLNYYPRIISRTIKENNIPYKFVSKNIKISNISLDTEQEIINKFNKCQSLRAVAKEYHCGQETIKKILNKNNIRSLSKDEYARKVGVPIEIHREIIDLYTKGNLSSIDIDKKFNLISGTTCSFLRKQKIPKHIQPKPIRQILLKRKDEVIQAYNELKNIDKVANRFNTKPGNITSFFKKENIPYDQNNKFNFSKEDILKLRDRQLTEKLSLDQLAKLYNCAPPTLTYNFKKFGIDWETITYKNYTLPEGKVIKLQGFEPQFLDYIFHNNLLKEQEIDLDPERIRYIERNKQRYYYPDFYIPKLNLIIEIKSTYVIDYRQGVSNLLLKESATKALGYNYLMILDNNFDEITKLLK